MLHRSTICFASCLLGGCMSFGGAYPHDWAERAQVEPGTCPAIDGEYTDVGEMFHEYETGYVKEEVSLTHMLAGWAQPKDQKLEYVKPHAAGEDSYRSVELRLSAEILRFVAMRADGGNLARDLPVRTRCESSLVALEPDWDASTILVASMVDRSRIQLGRATDGSLLVHVKNSGGLFLMYMPMLAGSDERWMRFPGISAQSADATVADAALARAH
ncbi:MAG TPA: hypothetical protein VH856_02250 [Steroidobacteraceae bacterium]|jgi:hypothetical protein